jgi:hypothetical protein
MKHLIAWVSLGCVVVSCSGTSVGTGGTETGNPATLEHFSASECKNEAPEAGQQALVRASDAEGLQCVQWSHDDAGVLQLELLNFPEPCGKKYLGAASLGKDGALELSVFKDTCDVLKCGSCVFDFEFQVKGVPADSALTLRTGSATCESKPITWDPELNLPFDEQPSGIQCRYLRRNTLEQYASSRGTCGQRNMPCGGCESLEQVCAAGLTCSPVADNDMRCLPSCEADDDCGGATSCRDGLCQSQLDW